MLKRFTQEEEIKNILSEVHANNPKMYELLMEKIEFSKYLRFKKATKQSIRKILAMGIKEYLRNLLSKKDTISKINNPSNKKKILFVTGVPSLNLVGISIYLRKTGQYETFLIGENPWQINFFKQHFDTVYIYNSYYEVARILTASKPDIIHIQGMPNYYFLGVLAKNLCSTATVNGFIDIPSDDPSIENPDKLSKIPANKLLDYYSEEFLFKKTEGILLVTEPSFRGNKLNHHHSSNVPIIEFPPYVCDEFFSTDEKYSQKDGYVYLVYGGSVAPSYEPKEQNPGFQFIDLAKNLVNQGLYFHMYVSPHFSPYKIKKLFPAYIQLAAKVPNFSFRQGLSIDKAIKEFSRYDFAVMINKYYDETKIITNTHWDTVIPSKFFTYLSAGLPIIVGNEFVFIASLVTKYEIGIVIKQNEIDFLAEIIKRYDYEKLKANVMQTREELSMKKHIGRLIDFYEQAVATKTQFHEIMARKV